VPTVVDWDRWAAYEHGGPAKVRRLVEHPTPVPGAATVIARFGSWKAAIAAAGLVPRFGDPGPRREQRCARPSRFTRAAWQRCKSPPGSVSRRRLCAIAFMPLASPSEPASTLALLLIVIWSAVKLGAGEAVRAQRPIRR
jgi:hypothetical protein